MMRELIQIDKLNRKRRIRLVNGKQERFKCEYGLPDCYNYYNKGPNYKKFEARYLAKGADTKVDRDLYMSIVRDALKLIKHRLIYDAKIITLPYLNDLSIIKRKLSIRMLRSKRSKTVDWKKTMEYGKKVVFLNEDRDFYVYKIIWNKYEMRLPHRTVYAFFPSRTLKEEVAKALKGSKSIDFPEPIKNTYPRYRK